MVGLGNFVKAWNDRQFWISLGFTLKYTLYITPILMIGGYLIALLVAEQHAAPALHPRRRLRARGHRPRRLEPALVLAVQLPTTASSTGCSSTSASSTKPVVWFGEDADRALWAVIVSIVWKVIGFGMILFVAAIQAIPPEINEAAMVDGASYWQRVRRITLPLTARTILLVTLISVIGSLLAFDQFYIMTAGQPRNQTATSVFWIYLNSFPYLKLGYGAALSLILAADHPRLHGRCRSLLTPPEPRMSARRVARRHRHRAGRDGQRAAGGGSVGRPDELPRRRHLRRALRDHAAAARRCRSSPRSRRTIGGGGGAADLLPARAQPRQLRSSSGTTRTGLPTYLFNSVGDGVPDHRSSASS